jgi:nicotinamidase-related amidase
VGPCGRILTRGEPGWDIIPELYPREGEPIIDKPGKGCFYATDLDLLLRRKGIRNLVIAGITTDVCVHTTMRDANDMGYECLLLTDCTGATDHNNHLAAISMVQKQGGVFGAVATADQFITAITAPAPHLAAVPPPPQANGAAAGAAAARLAAAHPYAVSLPLSTTALILIDFQRDFVSDGGFGSALGAQPRLLQSCLPAAQRLLAACRAAGLQVRPPPLAPPPPTLHPLALPPRHGCPGCLAAWLAGCLAAWLPWLPGCLPGCHPSPARR